MSLNNDFRQAFLNGKRYLESHDYVKARYWFEFSYNSLELRDESLSKLIQIDLKEGKYAKARNLLENIDNQSVQIKQVYGLLEKIENNFEESKKYYSECMVDPEMQNKSLLAIAKLYIQTGDNEVARKILETLKLNKCFRIRSIIALVCLNLLEQNRFVLVCA